MNELTKRQRYIKEKYFKVSGRDPFYYCPISNEKIKLSPISLDRIIDMIINILEEEYDGEINWVKIT